MSRNQRIVQRGWLILIHHGDKVDVQHIGHRGWRILFPHGDQVILFPHEDNCIQGIFHMPPWPNWPPWPCLDSQFPSNTELSLLCHNDESGRTLRLRTTCLISLKGWSRLCSGTSTRRRVAVRSFAHMLRIVAVPLSCRCWSMRYDAIDFIIMFHKFFLAHVCICVYNIFVLPLGLGSPGNIWLWLSKFKIIEASAYTFAYLHGLPAQVGLAEGIALLHAQAGNCMCYI